MFARQNVLGDVKAVLAIAFLFAHGKERGALRLCCNGSKKPIARPYSMFYGSILRMCESTKKKCIFSSDAPQCELYCFQCGREGPGTTKPYRVMGPSMTYAKVKQLLPSPSPPNSSLLLRPLRSRRRRGSTWTAAATTLVCLPSSSTAR